MQTEPGKYPWERRYVWGSSTGLRRTGRTARCPHCVEQIELLRIGDTEESLICKHYTYEPFRECPGAGLILSTVMNPDQMLAHITKRIEEVIEQLNSDEGENAHEKV